eukprot:732243-Amorphochlora_amoeboformis.AAC.1
MKTLGTHLDLHTLSQRILHLEHNSRHSKEVSWTHRPLGRLVLATGLFAGRGHRCLYRVVASSRHDGFRAEFLNSRFQKPFQLFKSSPSPSLFFKRALLGGEIWLKRLPGSARLVAWVVALEITGVIYSRCRHGESRNRFLRGTLGRARDSPWFVIFA